MNARNALSLASVWLLASGNAFAGMTVVTLTDVAAARIDALSFFLVTYLLISWAVKGIWNQLAKSFATLPILKYRQALGVVFVTGLLFYVVLTMISGARELLTPGAWEKQGSGYRLRDGEQAALTKEERRKALSELKEAIWAYAKANDGKAPSGPFGGEVAAELWNFGDGGFYALVPGVKPGGGREVMVYEPSMAGGRRFVLLADGTIEDRAEGDLKRELDRRLER
ncbi:MAG: hypothetical protein RLZZ505_331 [Verrucomicrobiota bacterium]|jgi:hypothetical protein